MLSRAALPYLRCRRVLPCHFNDTAHSIQVDQVVIQSFVGKGMFSRLLPIVEMLRCNVEEEVLETRWLHHIHLPTLLRLISLFQETILHAIAAIMGTNR